MKNFWNKNKNLIIFYFVVLVASILFAELSFVIQNTSFGQGDEMNTVISSTIILLMDIVVFSIFDMYIIKKVRNIDKPVSIKEMCIKYPQVVLVNTALAFVSYELGYAIAISANSYCAHASLGVGTVYTAVTALFLYVVKMFFGFSIQEVILNDEKMHTSIVASFKLVCKNLKKVIIYNIVFLVVKFIILAWCASMTEKFGYPVIYNIATQFADNLILVANTMLFIDLILKKEKVRRAPRIKRAKKAKKEETVEE